MQDKIIYPTTKANELLEIGTIDEYMEPQELFQRFPNLKHIKFNIDEKHLRKKVNYDLYLEQLCTLFQFKSFTTAGKYITKLPNSLWTKHLQGLFLQLYDAEYSVQPPADFDNQLTIIHLGGKVSVSANLFASPHLKEVMVHKVGNILVGLAQATALERLKIMDFQGTDLGFDPAPLTRLQEFKLQSCAQLHSLPHFATWGNLKNLSLAALPRLQNLDNDWDGLKNLEYLRCDSIQFLQPNGLIFNELPRLEAIEINHLKGYSTASFLGALPALKLLELFSVDVETFNEKAFNSPHLKKVVLNNCPTLTQLPQTLATHPTLERLEIINCKNTRVPKEVLTMKCLQHLHMELSSKMIQAFKIQISPYEQHNVLKSLKKYRFSTKTYLTIGALFIEGMTDWARFGADFLQLLETKEVLQPYVLKHLYFLNPKQKKKALLDLKGQTIALMPSVKGAKLTYRQKLTELGFKPQTTIRPDTNIIIVGNNTTELPTNFWQYPHYFFTEPDLNEFLTNHNPSFLQTEEAQSTETLLEKVRQLLWSAIPDSERLAVELLKNGGVPSALLPDLLLVAKDSDDLRVKNAIKKLIQGQLSVQELAILSQFRLGAYRMFQKVQWQVPTFDVAQMAVCLYQRRRQYTDLHHFFELTKDRNHPSWQLMYDAMLEQAYSEQDHLSLFAPLTTAEFTPILTQPRSTSILSLQIHCLETHLPPILFEMRQLKKLYIHFSGDKLPNSIEQLQQLEDLHLPESYLKTLPLCMLNMKNLKTIRIEYVQQLPKAFKILETQLEVFEVGDSVKYI